jgi:hypothetical protein
LYRIELHVNNASWIPLKPSLEHLHSQSNAWLEDKYLWNIGNLFLLDANLNNKINNKDFITKKSAILKKSNILSTNQSIKDYTKWGKDEILDRREKILKYYYENI